MSLKRDALMSLLAGVVGALAAGALCWQSAPAPSNTAPARIAPALRATDSPASLAAQVQRLNARMDGLVATQQAANQDITDLSELVEPPAGTPPPPADASEAVARVQAEAARLGRALSAEAQDRPEEARLQELLSAPDAAGNFHLLDATCSSAFCRMDLQVETGSADPVSALMTCPDLGGELMATPDEANPDHLVVYVAREGGRLPG